MWVYESEYFLKWYTREDNLKTQGQMDVLTKIIIDHQIIRPSIKYPNQGTAL
jgi:hypothetical protein